MLYLWLHLLTKRTLENTYWISSWRKEATQMLNVWLYLLIKREFEKTYQISSWVEENNIVVPSVSSNLYRNVIWPWFNIISFLRNKLIVPDPSFQHIYITISTITSVCPCVRPSGVRCASVTKFFFRLNHLGITPRLLGLTPGVDPGSPWGMQPLRRS